MQEYLDAGFTPAQAALLTARDQRYTYAIESLRSDMQRGFADTLATMQALFGALQEQMTTGFQQVNARLDRIDERLTRNGHPD